MVQCEVLLLFYSTVIRFLEILGKWERNFVKEKFGKIFGWKGLICRRRTVIYPFDPA